MAIWHLFRQISRRRARERTARAGESIDRIEILELLSSLPPFSRLSPRVTDLIASCLEPRSFRRGEILMRQGERGDHLLILLEGRVEIRIRLEDGSSRVLARLERGGIAGEMALITGEPRTADVVALAEGLAVRLRAADFERLCGRHPEISVMLTHLLAERLGRDEIDGLGTKTLGGYRIRRRLGRGGMAVVYEADDEAHQRKVALKMMSHDLVYQGEALERFHREADIVQSLRHPRIAAVFDRFDAYKTYFIVMELCDGISLRQLIDLHGPLPETAVRQALGQLAEALQYVHGRGVIHRDLKPSNAMVNRDGGIRLMDFGIARPAAAETRLTPTGIILGTPAYMAPEQLAGQPADERADLYALGLIGLEMLTGRPLFSGGDVASILYQKLTWRLPPREEIRADLSPELHGVLARLLENRPEKRGWPAEPITAWAAPIDPDLLVSRAAARPLPPIDSGAETRTAPGESP
ncbi:MAG: protein kinase [Planctomycetes bacterium]|nr:protein kinase [Planctomycetota bacterium]